VDWKVVGVAPSRSEVVLRIRDSPRSWLLGFESRSCPARVLLIDAVRCSGRSKVGCDLDSVLGRSWRGKSLDRPTLHRGSMLQTSSPRGLFLVSTHKQSNVMPVFL
jgi:hypothetical protein